MTAVDVLADLRLIVGPEHVVTDPDLTAGFETDWTRRFSGRALAVVRPRTTSEVAAVLRACEVMRTPVIPQGGNSGLVGGGVPRGGEVLLSLRRMNSIEEFYPEVRSVTVQAGTTLAALNEHCADGGLKLGVDLASRDSATIGGMIATNAGGIHVIRHGAMRRQILGIEAATASGDVLNRLPGLAKDNSGYDLGSLLAGSEGTLAVVTRARLRLVRVIPHVSVALLGFDDFASALQATSTISDRLSTVQAIEGFFPEGVELVCRHLGLEPPFTGTVGAYLLVESGAQEDTLPQLAAACVGLRGLLHTAAGSDRQTRDALWAYRERHTEAINMEGIPHKLDIAVPHSSLAGLPFRVREVLTKFPGTEPIMFGHVGDGNLHINILGAEPDDFRPDAAVFALVAKLGGSISAEHGIGIAKARYLGLTRSPAELAWMRGVKKSFDRWGILNPGVIFED